MNIRGKLIGSIVGLLLVYPSVGWTEEYVINAQARVFVPDILNIHSGDTVHFANMTSHDSVSVDGLIPEGAEPWDGGLGNNITLKLTVPGVYAYVCVPHLGFGMMGVIVVDEPVDIDKKLEWAKANLQGPYRRMIGKLLKVQRAAKGS